MMEKILTSRQLRFNSFDRLKAIVFIALLLSLAMQGLAMRGGGKPAVAANAQEQRVGHVIHISVDALGSKYLEKFLRESPKEFSNFKRLIREGASTMNARTDFSNTSTLPNHTCMLTGRPVKNPANWQACKGHQWEWNGNFPSSKAPVSIHANNPGGYVTSVFDIVHNNGLSTALYSGKSKFKLFTISYGPRYGARHPRGHNKIDHSIISWVIHARALADMKANKPAYTFLHYPDMDGAGHAYGYLGSQYRAAAKKVDGYLGDVLKLVENDPAWKNRTVIILSADHGGQPGTKGHGNSSHPYNYTIPFIVWGKGVARGADLYALNKSTRRNPGAARVPYTPTGQPVRNGDGANLALELLALPAIPWSNVNAKQDLNVR